MQGDIYVMGPCKLTGIHCSGALVIVSSNRVSYVDARGRVDQMTFDSPVELGSVMQLQSSGAAGGGKKPQRIPRIARLAA